MKLTVAGVARAIGSKPVVTGRVGIRAARRSARTSRRRISRGDIAAAPTHQRSIRELAPVRLFAYALPEAIGAVWTAAGDVYSLAATMYRALCGQPPYWPADADPSPVDVYRRMEREPVAQPSGVPYVHFAVLRRAMSFAPADRQASMDEFADDLADYPHDAADGADVTY